MKKILITGGTGFFSSRFVEKYKMEFNILALSRIELDITDEVKVMEVITKFKPDYLIHTAAVAETEFCEKNPKLAYEINVDGAVNVAKACKKVNGKLIFISTEQIFNGNINLGPYKESDTAVPDTIYGKSKLKAENLLKEIIDELWILRFTWLFDMAKDGFKTNANIMYNTVVSLLKNEKIVVSQNEYRGMTYVNEILENIKKVFLIPYGTYHLGSENDKSRYDVVKYIMTEMGLESRIDELLVKDEIKYIDKPRDIRLNTDKAKKNGIIFSTTQDGIKKCIRDCKLYGL
jgi:dTDP-4-dehydrorhamnose reductase